LTAPKKFHPAPDCQRPPIHIVPLVWTATVHYHSAPAPPPPSPPEAPPRRHHHSAPALPPPSVPSPVYRHVAAGRSSTIGRSSAIGTSNATTAVAIGSAPLPSGEAAPTLDLLVWTTSRQSSRATASGRPWQALRCRPVASPATTVVLVRTRLPRTRRGVVHSSSPLAYACSAKARATPHSLAAASSSSSSALSSLRLRRGLHVLSLHVHAVLRTQVAVLSLHVVLKCTMSILCMHGRVEKMT
jgi:hypothetical protein